MTPLEALQATLAGEHAALYLYGVLGGRASATPTLSTSINAAYAMHRARRDQLQLLVRELAGQPVAPEVAYAHGPVDTTTQIVTEARGIEVRSAEIYAQAVGSTTGQQRLWAMDALVDASVRSLMFGAMPETFPGLPEL